MDATTEPQNANALRATVSQQYAHVLTKAAEAADELLAAAHAERDEILSAAQLEAVSIVDTAHEAAAQIHAEASRAAAARDEAVASLAVASGSLNDLLATFAGTEKAAADEYPDAEGDAEGADSAESDAAVDAG